MSFVVRNNLEAQGDVSPSSSLLRSRRSSLRGCTGSWARRCLALLVVAFHGSSFAHDCGPNLLTYSATDAASSATGIRCVQYKFNGVDQSGAAQFDLTWYGEGKHGADVFRQLGFGCNAFGVCDHAATGAFISGNGETKVGKFKISLGVAESSDRPSRIDVTGDITETWTRVDTVDYVPLPPPSQCGPALEVFEVRAVRSSPGPIAGTRCLFRDDTVNSGNGAAWYGVGNWPGQTGGYAHLGAGTLNRWKNLSVGQASDICSSATAANCHSYPPGSLSFTKLSTLYKGYKVDGAWHEYWFRPGTYKDPVPDPTNIQCAARSTASKCKKRATKSAV